MRISAILKTGILSILSVAWLAVAGGIGAQSAPRTLTLGGSHGWAEVGETENIAFYPGWRGGMEVGLRHQPTPRTPLDTLFASFDTSLNDETGYHQVENEGGVVISPLARVGQGAAVFDGSAYLRYAERNGAWLAHAGPIGSFSIDAWIKPRWGSEGGELIAWNGVLVDRQRPLFQAMRIAISEGKVAWGLTNMVRGTTPEGDWTGSREIRGSSLIVPNRWTHLRLVYNAPLRQLRVEVDGTPEVIAYLDREQQLYIGEGIEESLAVGRGFVGYIDELRVARGVPDSTADEVLFPGAPGTLYTVPIPLGPMGTRVDSIRVRQVQPGYSEARVWYRVADDVDSDRASNALAAPWRPVEGASFGDQTRGRYLQLRLDLLPDAAGVQTPRVQEVEITYTPSTPPLPPCDLRGEPTLGGVSLSWKACDAREIAGYRLFVGYRPRRYYGTVGVESPIDVGGVTSITLDELEPDTAYVFALQSYDRFGQASALSEEVQVRSGGEER